MNAQATEIFREARAAHKKPANTVSTQPSDYRALALHYADEMATIAARVTVKRIISKFDPSLLSERDRWEILPLAARQILANAEAAGVGRFVPQPENSSTD